MQNKIFRGGFRVSLGVFLGFAHRCVSIPHILFGFPCSTVYIFPGFG